MATLNGRGQSVIEGGDVISRTPINENTEINSTWSDNADNFLGTELTGTNTYQCILDSRIGLDEPFMIAFTRFNQNTSLSTLEILTNKGDSTIPRISLGVKKILREDETELIPGNLYNFNILEYKIAADSGNGAFILKDFSKENKLGIITGSPHGFATQDIVHWNGVGWELADYTVPAYKKAIGIIKVLDANSFDLYFTGIIKDFTGFSLTSGAYYASTTQVGEITQSVPTTGVIHKILEVITDGVDLIPDVVITGLESNSNDKLDKGAGLSADYDTAKKIEDKIIESNPIGAITAYAGSVAPTGWLICDGTTFSAATYTDLNTLLGGNTLPDLRGEFIRGLDNGRGVDTGRTLGSAQSDLLKEHTHDILIDQSSSGQNTQYIAAADGPPESTNSRSIQNTGGTETRPRNIAFNYIIKAE